MAKKSIVVIGSSNTDMIIKLDRIPRPGETILGGEFVTAAGGKGANQAVAAARAAGRVSFIARVGKDVFGDQALAGFVKAHIDVEHVARDKAAPSGVALIFVARDGENSIAVASGANGHLAPADMKKGAEVNRLGCRRRDATRDAAGHCPSRRPDRGESWRERHPRSRARPAVV